jgi:hypothetical protein
MDVNFIPGVFWVELDFVSGNTNVSGSVANFLWQPLKQLELYAGVQVPATASGNEFAGNLGFMFTPGW